MNCDIWSVWTCGGLTPAVSIKLNTNCVCLTRLLLTSSTSADAINNAAGFGFNGYDEDGSPRWDLISNLRILNIEVRTISRAPDCYTTGSDLESVFTHCAVSC